MKFLKLICSLILIGLISAVALGVRHFTLPKPTNYTSKSAEAVYANRKIELYKLYSICDHLIKQTEYEINLNGLKELDLFNKYSEDAGWKIAIEDENIRLTQKIDGLCPKDGNARYLGVQNGFLSIYQGPAFLEGPLVKITDIQVDNLPLEWQEKVYNKTLEFSNESELLEALDSLDEYR